jgi:hypothetical protein
VLRWLSILLVALALVVAGCGGGDDEAAGDTTATVTETATEETTTEETTTGEDTSGATSGLPSADCLQAATAFSALAAAAAGVAGADPDESLKSFEAYADSAPEEIQDDILVLARGYAAYLEVWTKLGVKQGEQLSNDQIAELAKASEAFNTPEFQAASTSWDTWSAENCQN